VFAAFVDELFDTEAAKVRVFAQFEDAIDRFADEAGILLLYGLNGRSGFNDLLNVSVERKAASLRLCGELEFDLGL
jgi:Fic family protein